MSRKSSASGLSLFALIGLVAITFLAGLSLTGCGGSPSIGVTVTATHATVDGADSTTLTASVTNDNNSAGVTWTLSGAGKLTNTTTSSATYTAPAATSSSQTATITVTSVADKTKSATVTITVAPLPSISTVALGAGSVGTTYAVTLTATGGIAPYTWTIASGALPACLTLTNGAITGTPNAACAGNYSVSFKVTDSGTPTALTATTATLNLVINAAPAITFTGVMPATATYKLAYAGSAAATGGAGTLSYSATGLPAWLILNPASGAVAGTPTAVGTFNFTIKAADAYGDSNTQGYTITVNAEVPTLTFTTIPTKTYGNAPFQVSATDAAGTPSSGAITYTVTSGPATIAGNMVTLTGAGTVVLGASQAASGDFAAATATTSFTVLKATATINVTPYSVTYDGNAHTATATATGVSGANLIADLTLSGTTHTNAGTYASDAWSFTDPNGNYASANGTVSDTISKATATINVTPYSVTYDGNPHTATGTATGVGGANLIADLTLSGTTHTNAGTYASDAWSFTDPNGNYASASGTVSDAISKATATINVTPYSVTYDGNPHTVTATATGVGGVTLSATDFTLTGTTHTSVGTYASDPWSFTDPNYASASGTVSDTISKATATINVTPYSVTYDGSPHTATATATGAGGVNLIADLTLTGTTHTSVGTYASDPWSFTDPNGNYASASGTVSDTISKATATINVTPYSVTYDGNPHTATATATGAGGVNLIADLNLSGTTHTNAGSYTTDPWSFSDPTGNYANASGTVSDTINGEAITLTFTTIPTHTFGDPAFQVTASDTGGVVSTGAITYSVTSGPATIISSTGLVTLTGVGTVVLGASQAASGNYAAATASISFTVNPALSITTTSPLPAGVVNTQYSQTLAATGGTGGYVWTTNSAGTASLATVNLTLSSGGTVSGKPAGTGSATFAATVTDSASHTATVTFTVTVTNALTVTKTSLPPAYTNALYSQTLTAAGGTGTGYAWSTTGTNNLSTFSLALSNGGVLSGTPITTGTATFTAQVKDSGGNTATQALSIPVYAPLSLPAANPATLGPATTNLLYSGTIVAAGGSGSGYVFTVTGLPSDSLQNAANNGSNTLTIGGTPTLTQTVSFQVSVKDSLGNSAGPVTYTIAVKPPTPLTLQTSGALSPATTNQAYSGAVKASGGSGSGYVFTVNGVQIPTTGALVAIADSISVSNNGGSTLSISGTPTLTQTVSITSVTVKDSAGDTAGPDTYTIAVNPPTPLTLQASGALSPATTNQAYSGAVNASGGSGSGYVFTVNGTQIPTTGALVAIADSISVSNNGGSTLSISGTPTTAQTVSLTSVTVKDSAGDTAGPDTYTIAVNPPTPLTLQAGGSLTAATTNVAYNGGISASGGSGSGYVFTVNGVQVPITGALVAISDSISVSSTGTTTLSISGTPLLTAEVTLTNVMVKDGAGDTAGPDTYTIAVNPPSPLTLQASGALPAATTNVGYSQSISASGGSGLGYVFTVNGTQIPNTGAAVLISDSISVSSTGGSTLSISGTPTLTGTVTLTNVTVKDSAADSAGPDTYTIAVNAPGSPVSGQVALMNYCNNGSSFTLPTFTVSINTSPVQTTATDGSGNYTFAAIPNGTYTITPSITGATSLFYPATLTNVVVNNSTLSAENFNATVGYAVSGTVSYGGAASGPIYVELNSNCGGNGASNGVTLTAKGAFTIHGVSPGSYTLNSWRDNLGVGAPNASNPTATVSNLTVSNAAVTGVAVALADPGTISLSAAPTLGPISGIANGVFINYKPILNKSTNGNSIELPTSYTVQWNTTNSFTSPAGSHSFPASGDHTDLWFLNSANVTGLTSGSSYYFRAQGVAGSSASNWSSTVGPIKLAAPAAANTVTGTVTFTGTATGPLYVIFYDQSTSNAWITQVGTKALPPTSPASYSVQVPSGTYGFVAIIDQNNNGLIDVGDLTNVNGGGNGPPPVTISGSTTESVTLPSAASTVSVTTQYSPNTSGSGIAIDYNLNFDVREGVKLPVAATLSSGPNVIDPVDMGACGSNCGTPQFQYYANTGGYLPKVGDSYGFHVTYSDGTTGTLTGTVTGVLGASALPTLIAPTGSDVSDTPNFDWTYPSSASSYSYQFYICCGNNGDVWDIPGNNSNSKNFTSSQITPPLLWDHDPTDPSNAPSPSTLSAGNYYSWSLQAQDANGNSAQASLNFQTTPGPVSLPAANTNPLPSGTVNVPYSAALNASGGAGGGNYYFTVNSTIIPTNNSYVSATNSDGLTFANSGGNTLFVGGTPTSTASPLSLTIEVFDTTNGSDHATVTYTIVISAETSVSLPAASSNPLASAVVSMPYGGSLSASGGSGSYSFTVNGTTIPSDGTTYVSIASGDGLSATSYSGGSLMVAGTPASVESVSLDVKVTDTNNSSDTATVTYTLPVVSAPNGVNNSRLNGTYVCKTNMSEDSNHSALASVSSFVLDGNGHITSGIFDINGVGFSSAGSGTSTGTYAIGADNNGLATTNYTLTAGGTGSGSNTWAIALTNATSPAQEFRMVEADDLGGSPSGQNGTANCYLATTSAFAVSTISSRSFALGFQGANSSNILKEYVGRFTASTATGSGSSATGTITSGYLDGMRLDQTGDSGGAFTGSYTGPNSNGRFTITVIPPGGGSGTLAAYIVDASRMFLLEIAGDTGVLSGEMRTQQQASYSNANLSGAALLYSQALEYTSGSVSGFDSQIYQVSGNGSGSLTVNQSYDDNNGTYAVGSENGGAVTVTFDSANPGRATFTSGSGDSNFLYFYNTNSAFYLDLNGGGSPNYLATGWLEPQTQTTFTDAALAGTYLLAEVHLKPGDASVGEAVVASNGTVTASVSTGGQNSFSFDSAQSGLSYTWLNSTYGSFSLTETGQSGGETCMVITASKDICMDGTSGSAKMSVLQK